MILKIAMCDDDKNELSLLYSYLNTFQMMNNIDLQLASFCDGKSLLDIYTSPGKFHVVFLDVEMPGLNGIQTAELIRKMRDRRVMIVFVSNYPKYMQESFSVHPYYYMQKPISLEKVIHLMNNIIQDIEDEKVLRTLIQNDQSEETINLKDVLYIETADGKKELLQFHLLDRCINTRGIITKWEKELADYNFLLCHRGLLVNLVHIHFFDQSDLVLSNGERLPMSRKYERKLRDLYLNRVVILKNY